MSYHDTYLDDHSLFGGVKQAGEAPITGLGQGSFKKAPKKPKFKPQPFKPSAKKPKFSASPAKKQPKFKPV